jgi:hypothetical protein
MYRMVADRPDENVISNPAIPALALRRELDKATTCAPERRAITV